MNIATIIILVLLTAAVWGAFQMMRRHRCGSCEGCTCNCDKRQK